MSAAIRCIAIAAAAAMAWATLGMASEASPASPELELRGLRPVAVHGTGFRANERVRLVLRRPSGAARRRTRAGPGGEFSSRFPAVAVDGCSGFSIAAKGGAGSRATLLRRVPRGCPPP